MRWCGCDHDDDNSWDGLFHFYFVVQQYLFIKHTVGTGLGSSLASEVGSTHSIVHVNEKI